MNELTSAERVLRVLRREEPDRVPALRMDHRPPGARRHLPRQHHGGIHRAHGAGRHPHRAGLPPREQSARTASATSGAPCSNTPPKNTACPWRAPSGRWRTWNSTGRPIRTRRAASPASRRLVEPLQGQAGHRRASQRRALDSAQLDGLREPHGGLRRRPGAGARPGRTVREHQPRSWPRKPPSAGRTLCSPAMITPRPNGHSSRREMFRERLATPLKRVMTGFKELGLFVIKHTDGNIRPILDLIVDAGIDALDPIDPLAGLDIGEMKRQARRARGAQGQRRLRPHPDQRHGASRWSAKRSASCARRPRAAA